MKISLPLESSHPYPENPKGGGTMCDPNPLAALYWTRAARIGPKLGQPWSLPMGSGIGPKRLYSVWPLLRWYIDNQKMRLTHNYNYHFSTCAAGLQGENHSEILDRNTGEKWRGVSHG